MQNYFLPSGLGLFTTEPLLTISEKYFELPLSVDFTENDESYQTFKELPFLNFSKNIFLTGVGIETFSPQTHITVFNNFRGDYSTPY